MKLIIIVVLAIAGFAAGFSSFSRKGSTTEKPLYHSGKNVLSEKAEISPVAQFNANEISERGLTEVSEHELPDGVPVFVLEETQAPREKGESMSTADNIVFRPLFQYRNRQEAIAKRRIANNYRRRYFIQKRPYRNAHNRYYYYRWH